MAEPNAYCVVLTRRADCSREQFLATWANDHRKLIERLPHLLEARLMPVAEPEPGGPDGVGLLLFPDSSSLKEALASDAAKALRQHTATFAQSDKAQRFLLVTEWGSGHQT